MSQRLRRARFVLGACIGVTLLGSVAAGVTPRLEVPEVAFPSRCEAGGLIRLRAQARPDGAREVPRGTFALGEPRVYVPLVATSSVIASVPANIERWSGMRPGRSPQDVEVTGVLAPDLGAHAKGVLRLDHEPCVLWLEDFPPGAAAALAVLLGVAAAILIWRGVPAIEPLGGPQLVLLTGSELAQLLIFAAIAVATALATTIDLALRASGARLVWSFPIGTLTYLAAPTAIALIALIRPLARWIGLGVPKE